MNSDFMMSLSMPAAEPEHAGADVGNVSEFEQALNGPILAERAVQHGEDHIDVDGAIAGAASEGRVALKRHQAAIAVHRLRRHDD